MKKNKKKLSPLIMLLIGGAILTLGDIFATEWVRVSGSLFLYFITMIFYIIAMAILIKSYEGEDIPVASIILVMFNVTILTIVGVLIFGEEVTASKIVGIILGIISLILLEFGKKKIFVSR
ncbi:MAG: hypothetical protein WC711_02590 [Candidatus Staskawiczbacteria bacterium]|jgi:multidrug transporter EmrE-like cation transporter